MDDFVFTKPSKTLYEEIVKEMLGSEGKDNKKKKLKLEKELDSANQRIEKLQDLLVDGAIDSIAYGKTLSRYAETQRQLETEIASLKVTKSDYTHLVEKGYHFLRNFKKSYQNSDIDHKVKLISSIFPEYVEFDGEKCRTPRINDFLRFILQIDKDLDETKKGQISNNLSLSLLVVPTRIELISKV